MDRHYQIVSYALLVDVMAFQIDIVTGALEDGFLFFHFLSLSLSLSLYAHNSSHLSITFLAPIFSC